MPELNLADLPAELRMLYNQYRRNPGNAEIRKDLARMMSKFQKGELSPASVVKRMGGRAMIASPETMAGGGTKRIIGRGALAALKNAPKAAAEGVGEAVARRAIPVVGRSLVSKIGGPVAMGGLAALMDAMERPSGAEPYNDDEKLAEWRAQFRPTGKQYPPQAGEVQEIDLPDLDSLGEPGSLPQASRAPDLSPAPEGTYEGELVTDEQQAAESGDAANVNMQAMLDLVPRVFGGERPTFDGQTMTDPMGNAINLANNEAVAEYASTLMDAMPSEEAPAPAPRRIQMAPMAVQGRGPQEMAELQAMDSMASRSLARTKARMGGGRPRDMASLLRQSPAGVEVPGVIEEPSVPRMGEMRAQQYASLVDKLGFDPAERAIPSDFDISSLNARDRWLLRQLGAMPKRQPRQQRVVKGRR